MGTPMWKTMEPGPKRRPHMPVTCGNTSRWVWMKKKSPSPCGERTVTAGRLCAQLTVIRPCLGRRRQTRRCRPVRRFRPHRPIRWCASAYRHRAPGPPGRPGRRGSRSPARRDRRGRPRRARGQAGLDRVWRRPELLPSPDELAEPSRWLVRLAAQEDSGIGTGRARDAGDLDDLAELGFEIPDDLGGLEDLEPGADTPKRASDSGDEDGTGQPGDTGESGDTGPGEDESP